MRTPYTTESFAQQVGSKPQTVRKNYCQHGHYLGVRPVKLPNGKLLWPASAVERLITGADQVIGGA